jgi:hypothetical protein
MDIIPAFGWSRNLRLSNGDIELIVTLDVGPRILSYKFEGGTNVLKVFDDQVGKSGESDWMIRGGHRLWVAPEDPEITYATDNGPVDVGEPEPGLVRLTSATDRAGFRKEIDIRLESTGSGVELIHRIRNVSAGPMEVAAWALTVIAPGGTEIIPLPAKSPHPGHPSKARSASDFAPNLTMVLWPFTDLGDDRWRFGQRYITLAQHPGRGPTKIGLAHTCRAVGYLNGDTLFVKRFAAPDRSSEYPDRGCNFETFTNQDMLEMESLGPLVDLVAGESVELIEQWELHGGVGHFDRSDESSIESAVGSYLTPVG